MMQPAPVPPPGRPEDGHKGTFGTVLVVGGRDDANACMVGGPAFAALAALRVGAGRAQLAVPRSIAEVCLSVTPSATVIPLVEQPLAAAARLEEVCATVDAIIIGPGLGTEPIAIELMAVAAASDRPLLIDADGLNLLAANPRVRRQVTERPAAVVLTPHPGEFQRLASAMNLSTHLDTPPGRSQAAGMLAEAMSAVVVLKGAGTIVAGQQKQWVCERGSVVLATAGTGDVLCGVIGGLLGAGTPSFDAACLGVWIHAVAGELWAQRHGDAGLLAAELAEEIPPALVSSTHE